MALKWRWYKGLVRKGKIATLETTNAKGASEVNLSVLPETKKVSGEEQHTGRFVPFASVTFMLSSRDEPKKNIKEAKRVAVKLALKLLADIELYLDAFVDDLTEEIT